MSSIDEQIIDLVAEIAEDDEVADDLDVDLFEEDYLDSMAAIELLVEIQDRFGVQIAPTELERDEMNTVRKIIARVSERM